MKTATSIKLSQLNKRWAEDNISNLSGWIEKMIEYRRLQATGTSSELRIQEIESELKEIRKKEDALADQKAALNFELQEVQQKVQAERQKAEAEEAKKEEAARKCANCGGWIQEERYKNTPIGKVCNTCFWAQPKDIMREWLEWQKEKRTE